MLRYGTKKANQNAKAVSIGDKFHNTRYVCHDKLANWLIVSDG